MNSSPLPETEPASGVRATPGSFTLQQIPPGTTHDPRFDESLLDHAIVRGPVAAIWQARQGLVVPRTYRRFDAFEASCTRFARLGWPVTVRQTGGGIVPQGPGILNLSLAYCVNGPAMRHSEPGYLLICQVLSDAFRSMGIDAFPAAVEGSFCDGRYNLAVRLQGEAVKIVGTAQMWRRVPGSDTRHVGLVHALAMLDVDTAAVTEVANTFEAAIGSGRRYRADRVVSATELLVTAHGLHEAFEDALTAILTRCSDP